MATVFTTQMGYQATIVAAESEETDMNEKVGCEYGILPNGTKIRTANGRITQIIIGTEHITKLGMLYLTVVETSDGMRRSSVHSKHVGSGKHFEVVKPVLAIDGYDPAWSKHTER